MRIRFIIALLLIISTNVALASSVTVRIVANNTSFTSKSIADTILRGTEKYGLPSATGKLGPKDKVIIDVAVLNYADTTDYSGTHLVRVIPAFFAIHVLRGGEDHYVGTISNLAHYMGQPSGSSVAMEDALIAMLDNMTKTLGGL